MNERDLFNDQATPPFKNPHAAGLVDRCRKCGGTDFVNHPLMHAPHNGRSLRRDCRRCGWTFGFPIWYGVESEAAE